MSYITHCHDIDYYVYPMIPYSEQKNYISTYKKTWESKLIAHPARSGSGIAHLPRISNAEAHVVYSKDYIHLWTLNTALPCGRILNLPDSNVPQIKRQSTSFYMSVSHSTPYKRHRMFDTAKIRYFCNNAVRFFCQKLF